jgi:hypothetical protein
MRSLDMFKPKCKMVSFLLDYIAEQNIVLTIPVPQNQQSIHQEILISFQSMRLQHYFQRRTKIIQVMERTREMPTRRVNSISTTARLMDHREQLLPTRLLSSMIRPTVRNI